MIGRLNRLLFGSATQPAAPPAPAPVVVQSRCPNCGWRPGDNGSHQGLLAEAIEDARRDGARTFQLQHNTAHGAPRSIP